MKHGSSEVVITIDDAPGGTARVITPYVLTLGGIKIENLTQQSNPFGSTSEAHSPTGMTKTADIAMGGLFDDTALVGPAVVLKPGAADRAPNSVGRELVIVAATGHTFTITVHLVSYEVKNKNGALTEYEALVRQAGAGVWS